MSTPMLVLTILIAVLLIAIIAIGIFVLVQRKRARSADWLRVSGSVVGEKKLRIPGCWRAYVLYRDPMTNKNATAFTCMLTKRPELHKKAVLFDLMVWKDKNGKTRKQLYPTTAKTLDLAQTVKVRQTPYRR